MNFMDPAWDATFILRTRNVSGLPIAWELKGEISNERFILREAAESEIGVLGELVVHSWQPYEQDAVSDTVRAAWDVAITYGVRCGGTTVVEPVLPAEKMERLVGAKDFSGTNAIRIRTAHAQLSITCDLAVTPSRLDAAASLHEDPALRAYLDTLFLAKSDRDPVSAFVHLYRIYDDRAAKILKATEPALSDAQVAEATEGALRTLAVVKDERQRLQSTITGALKKLRIDSRVRVLSREWSALLGREVTVHEVEALDRARAALVHKSHARETEPEGNALLSDVVNGLLQRDVDSKARGRSEVTDGR